MEPIEHLLNKEVLFDVVPVMNVYNLWLQDEIYEKLARHTEIQKVSASTYELI